MRKVGRRCGHCAEWGRTSLPRMATADVQDLSLSGILTWHTVDAVAAADAMVIREALDPLIFAEAARFPSEEVIADLRIILTDMVRSIGSPDAFVDADVRFHTRMADMCQNTALRNLYQDLIRRISSGLRYIDSAEASATGPYLQTRLKIHAISSTRYRVVIRTRPLSSRGPPCEARRPEPDGRNEFGRTLTT